ncbi:MAG: DUF3050 domain-containing protein [Nitrospinae bacterium]|nr:DUF3050 domain-containing protein [Nitrospinota bacterium]
MNRMNIEKILSHRKELETHPVYEAVNDIQHLHCFMEHHIYSVWDFMSLVKYLQNRIAPTTFPWTPQGDGSVKRFINELVMEEETDQAMPDKEGNETFGSHFELYCGAMTEIGANTNRVMSFIDVVRKKGINEALSSEYILEPSRRFTTTTFDFIKTEKPHVIASALTFGREHIIPAMFRALLKDMNICDKEAPVFHYYLNRHIHLDEDFHAPLSLKLLFQLCENDEQKSREAEEAAFQAIQARIDFWNGVLKALNEKV